MRGGFTVAKARVAATTMRGCVVGPVIGVIGRTQFGWVGEPEDSSDVTIDGINVTICAGWECQLS